jgi:formylglycine-generating enzyme required for sulfatase activity
MTGEPGPSDKPPTELIDPPAAASSQGHLPTAAPPRGRADVPTAVPPPHVPGYRMLRAIGSGGQGLVFLAEQASTARPVAVKVLPGGPFVDPRVRARFDREASILAALDHPNVVRIVDRCRTDDGCFALVMDYVEGRPIDDVLAERSVTNDARAVVAMFAAVADGVDEAHRRGIVHRDLKPSNVLVDARGTPRVLDFGVARLTAGSASAADTTVTETGQMVGSLPWASPEQIIATEPDAIDARSDVYALGVMLYRALAGQPPYAVSGSIGQVLHAIQHADPAPPHALPGGRARGADAALSAVVLKAMAKRPGDRYASAGELAGELRRWAAGHRPVAMYAVLRRTRVRRSVLVALAAAGAGAIAVAAVIAPYDDAPRPPAPGTVTVVPLDEFTNSVGMRFVLVPPGKYTMGSPAGEPGRGEDERPIAMAIAAPTWFATTEVTRGQYRTVMGALPSGASPAGEADGVDEGDELPVDGVTWDEAVAFCRALGRREGRDYRLPMEAEWEWACRAGSNYPWGGTGRPDDMAWHAGNSGSRLHPVGRKRPNVWGLFDMHGNVAEWCADVYDPAYRPTPDPPDGAATLRTARGGSGFEPHERCRSAARAAIDTHQAGPGVGFRVVLTEPIAATTQPPGQVVGP